MTKEYMEGHHWGFKHGMFENKNPYRPGSLQFEHWELGFKKGYQSKGWL